MNQNIILVGIDVYDTRCYGSAFYNRTGEVIEFKCRPGFVYLTVNRP